MRVGQQNCRSKLQLVVGAVSIKLISVLVRVPFYIFLLLQVYGFPYLNSGKLEAAINQYLTTGHLL